MATVKKKRPLLPGQVIGVLSIGRYQIYMFNSTKLTSMELLCTGEGYSTTEGKSSTEK